MTNVLLIGDESFCSSAQPPAGTQGNTFRWRVYRRREAGNRWLVSFLFVSRL